MSQRIPLGPIDAEGVRYDRPANQVRWTELVNVVFHDGKIVTRPGFITWNGAGGNDLGSVQPYPIVSIHEIFNPGNSATGRESYTPAGENLVPDGSSDIVAGWTASDAGTKHEAVDEGTPDAAEWITATTLGSSAQFTFGNPATAFKVVTGVVFHIRARIDAAGNYAKLNFYYRSGGTNYAIGSEYVTVRTDQETDDWQDIFVSLSHNPASNVPMNLSFLQGLNLVVELDSSEAGAVEILTPDGDGATTGWSDYTDDSTAVYTNCQGTVTFLHYYGTPTGLPSANWMYSKTANAVQLFTFTSSAVTWDAITNVRVHGYARHKDLAYESFFDIVYSDGDTGASGDEYTLSNFSIDVGEPGRGFAIDVPTNPDDDAAWAAADINNGSFGIKFLRGSQINLGSFGLWINGTVSGATEVQVDTINAYVSGFTTSALGDGLIDKIRLFSSSLNHFRNDDDTTFPTITDVTNSVPLNSTGVGWPVQHAVLYGQVYLVNGVDPTVYYPDGSNTYSELSTNNADGATVLTGRAIAAFAGRIFYGWVMDNGTVTPERVAYSQIRDGSTHNHISAGDFDLLDTPGGVVALIPLDETLMAALKEKGIYTIRHTGNATIPFIRDVVDFQTSCLGSKTAVRVQRPDGSPVVLFLGENPTDGLNVYAFDGNKVMPVGNQIAEKLREDMNRHAALITAHAAMDPRTNTYWLFIPEDTDGFPQQAWVMSLVTGEWTRAEFPWDVYCSGNWHLPDLVYLGDSASQEVIGGIERLMLGAGRNATPLAGVDFRAVDEIGHPSSDNSVLTNPEVRDDFTQGGRSRSVYTAKMTTGDLVKPGDMDSVSYRIDILWKSVAVGLRVSVDVSEDGGNSWNTAIVTYLDQPTDVDATLPPLVDGWQHSHLDLTPTSAPVVRYRIQIGDASPTYDGSTAMSVNTLAQEMPFEIGDMWLTIESGADDE